MRKPSMQENPSWYNTNEINKNVSMCEVWSIDSPDWATPSTVLVTVQHDSRVTPVLSEPSDNRWPRTIPPMEDYEDLLSLCWSAYYIDFVILVIGLYFCAAEYCCNFLCFFSSFSLSTSVERSVRHQTLWCYFIMCFRNFCFSCCRLLLLLSKMSSGAVTTNAGYV